MVPVGVIRFINVQDVSNHVVGIIKSKDADHVRKELQDKVREQYRLTKSGFLSRYSTKKTTSKWKNISNSLDMSNIVTRGEAKKYAILTDKSYRCLIPTEKGWLSYNGEEMPLTCV
jgi:hypothetical protein